MYNVSSDGEGGGRPRRSPPRPPCPGSGISAGTSDPASAPRLLWSLKQKGFCFRFSRNDNREMLELAQSLASTRRSPKKNQSVIGFKDWRSMVSEAVYRFLCALTLHFFPFNLQKQSELLLNVDDLDAMWVCLRENCVIDDATGAEKMNYEDFCQIASICMEQIGPKCRRFFSPSNFMKFEKDESGRIAILPFYLYVMRTVSLTQARIDMSELDEDSDGFLQLHEMEAYIRGLIPNLAQLCDMPADYFPMYCRIAAHKFFCDPHWRGKACIKKVLLSNSLPGAYGTASGK